MRIVVIDQVAEEENGNDRRTTVPPGLYLDHILALRRSLGLGLQYPHLIRPLLVIIPENVGGLEDPNDVANDTTVGLHEETRNQKMNFQRINVRFLSLSWL